MQRNLLGSDVYDVDANGRKAPTYLRRAQPHDAVVWETGDDIITRRTRLARRDGGPLGERHHARDARVAWNAGGGVLYTGKNVGTQYTGAYSFDPKPGAGRPVPGHGTRALLSCSRARAQSDLVNDVLEYWSSTRAWSTSARA